MNKALLSFSLTPVQSFIEAARTVRDLKGGSRILTHLTWTAMSAGMDKSFGGSVLFPDVGATGNAPESIPNLFLMTFDDECKAKDAAGACVTAVTDRWKTLAETVREAVGPRFRTVPNGADWAEGWDHQIEHFWDIQTVVLLLSETDTVLQKMLGLSGTTTADDLGRQFRAMQALLAAKKMVRNFPGDNGIGRHKCAMMGELEQMGPAGLKAADDFWKVLSEQPPIEQIRLAPRDRLCAVSLVKRFAKLDPGLKPTLSGDVPDTAAVATADWWARARSEADAGDDQQGFEVAVKTLRERIGDEADTERRYLLMDDLTPSKAETITKRETGRKTEVAPAEVVRAFEGVAGAREALLDVVKTHDGKPENESQKIGAPPRYYAILVQDGDEMGSWLSGEKLPEGTKLTDEFLQTMSRDLQEYAGKVSGIVADHHGYTVYAGGDDALAMLPLSRALDCAERLRCEFPKFGPSEDTQPTLTAGMAIVHHMHDLRSALRAARAVEKRAKDQGRNSLGIALVKRSGGPVDLVLDWDLVPALLKLQKLFEAGLSDRWLNKVAQAVPAMGEWGTDREALGCIVGHATKGLQLSKIEKAAVAKVLAPCEAEEAEGKVRDHIAELWGTIWDRLASRNRRVRNADHDAPDCPLPSEDRFAPAALQEFVHFGQAASFLTRGRD